VSCALPDGRATAPDVSPRYHIRAAIPFGVRYPVPAFLGRDLSSLWLDLWPVRRLPAVARGDPVDELSTNSHEIAQKARSVGVISWIISTRHGSHST
jgi:hypothetical protein